MYGTRVYTAWVYVLGLGRSGHVSNWPERHPAPVATAHSIDACVVQPCCVRIPPASPQAWNVLGLCSTSQGDIRDGVKAYERATELNPKLKEAWVNMGQVGAAARVSLGFALNCMCGRATGLGPKPTGVSHFAAVCRPVVRTRLTGSPALIPCPLPAQALKEEGRTKEAERALTRALALDPPDQPSVHVLRVLAQMRQQLGEHAAAVRLLERAVPMAQQKEEQVGRVGAIGRCLDLAEVVWDAVQG